MTKTDNGKFGAMCLMSPVCERKAILQEVFSLLRALRIFDKIKTETRTRNFGVLYDSMTCDQTVKYSGQVTSSCYYGIQ